MPGKRLRFRPLKTLLVNVLLMKTPAVKTPVHSEESTCKVASKERAMAATLQLMMKELAREEDTICNASLNSLRSQQTSEKKLTLE